jgi:dephospho-CoA kinase
MDSNKIVIGVAGMAGSGKSVIVDIAKRNGYAIVTMGDVIREETKNRGLELNPENMGRVMLGLREKGGNAVIAEKCIPKINESKNTRIIIDGIRSLAEAETFGKHFVRFTLVAVHASPETRFKRLDSRGRSDDTDKWEVFHERDIRELSVGLGNAIAMAEYVLINDKDHKSMEKKVIDLLGRIDRKWKK